jgi:glycosyltransferase involved in cell wall biosynthesis/ubiquinone/menaquinone biosynthesis C-methylase UbiE
MEFTGERFVPEVHGNIELEHLHRYLLACKVATGKVVLDIASGEGYGSAMLAKVAHQVIGVDISQEAVTHAQAKYQAPNIEFRIGSCSAIPLENNSVDVIVSFETIEHHDEHDAMMQEIKRVLRPSGVLVISSPDKFEFTSAFGSTNAHHVKELYREEFTKLLEEYFKNHIIYGQKVIYGSAIFREKGFSEVESFELGDHSSQTIHGVPHAVYLVAVATDAEPPLLASGMLEQRIEDTDFTHFWQKLTAKRDEQIAGLSQSLSERDEQIVSLNQSISKRDEHITSLNQSISESDHKFALLNQSVSQYEGQINDLKQYVTERSDQIAALDQRVADVKRELEVVLGSKSWQLTKPLRFFRRLFAAQPNMEVRSLVSRKSRLLWRKLPFTFESKQRFKNSLFRTFPIVFRWSTAYQAWASLSLPFYTAATNKKLKRRTSVTGDVDVYVPLLIAKPLDVKPAKIICFYLPQFHAIPENNEWWGNGFTEWTNVQPAQPQFEGHYQPHVPGELGYYHLLDTAVQRRQVELAKLYGIGGFCFYFYWFGGKRLLEAPLENYLKDSSLDLPFCLCWANENWSRRWDGLDSEILIAQQHSADDDLAFIQHVARYLRDPRYIRIDGRPLLLVYRPSLLPSAKATTARWREWCRNNDVGEIYLAYTQSFEMVDPAKYGFDAAVEFPPNNSAPPNITDSVTPLGDEFCCTVYDGSVFVERSEHFKQPDYTLIRGVCASWDNTARRKNRGTVFLDHTPELYQRWLENAISDTVEHRVNPDERLIFVNAWNEWAEGAHLEPDARYGYAWLQATRNALTSQDALAQRPILIVTHDCHPHGAQFLILEMTRQLVRNGYKPAIVALDGGKLQDEFARLGPMLVLSSSGEAALDVFLVKLRNRGCTDAITSTVVSGSILPTLKKQGYRVLSLIHELSGVIHAMKQEENARHVAALADKIVFPAEMVRNQFEVIAPMVAEKVVVRPQGLLRKNPYLGKKLEAHRVVCQRHGLSPNIRIVLNIGFLDDRKGPDLFVDIAAQVCKHRNDTVFIWVGHTDPGVEKKVKLQIASLGLQKKVLLAGFNASPLDYYAAASVYALTSREDPFPNVVLESVSVGVPVVAFDGTTGAADFILEHGGLLARHLAVTDFADNVEALLDREAKPQPLPDLSLQRYVLDLLHSLNGLLRVSVIVPNYNYARLIESRLDSIRMQAYPVYEIIVLDDASTDSSVACIESALQKSQIDAQLHVNDVNSGSVFRQWVKGSNLATGDLVWIAEADDIADSEFLVTLVNAFNHENVVLAFSQSRQIDENGLVLANDYLAYTGEISDRWRNEHFCEGMDEIRASLSIKNVIPNVSGVLFSRQALKKALADLGDTLFDYRVAGDWLVYLNVLAQGRLYYCAKSLNDHRRHQQSVTSATGLENHLAEVTRAQAIAQGMARPDEKTVAQANEYLEKLRTQFELDKYQ